jgi:two-component system phosphate regulon response regulator PhoB
MPDATVLAVDPDQTVLSFFRRLVTGSGYVFRGARRAEAALRRAREAPPDAVFLRVALPDMTGAELVARLREEEDATRSGAGSAIVLTALRGQEEGVAAGLEGGAVSVLFFPIEEAEVSARLGGLLRWARRPREDGVLSAGPIAVDFERGMLVRPEARALTATELEILRWLLNPPGRAVTRRQLGRGAERSVDVHVAALRAKLGGAGECIETLRGVGYRLRGAACP